MRISDWSSDVCSSDLRHSARPRLAVRRTAEWAALCGAQQWRAAGAGVDPGADGRRLDVRNRKGARLRPPARAPDLSRFRTYSGWRGEAQLAPFRRDFRQRFERADDIAPDRLSARPADRDAGNRTEERSAGKEGGNT